MSDPNDLYEYIYCSGQDVIGSLIPTHTKIDVGEFWWETNREDGNWQDILTADIPQFEVR